MMRERVAAGFRLLDAKKPGWPYMIDLASLDLGDVKSCVLGQLYREYDKGKAALGLDTFDSTDHGFRLGLDDDADCDREVAWQRLTDAWDAAIRERRGDS